MILKNLMVTALVLVSAQAFAGSTFLTFNQVVKVTNTSDGGIGLRGYASYSGGSAGFNSSLSANADATSALGGTSFQKKLLLISLQPAFDANGKYTLYSATQLSLCHKSMMLALLNPDKFKFCINVNDGSGVSSISTMDVPSESSLASRSSKAVIIYFKSKGQPTDSFTSVNCPIVPADQTCE